MARALSSRALPLVVMVFLTFAAFVARASATTWEAPLTVPGSHGFVSLDAIADQHGNAIVVSAYNTFFAYEARERLRVDLIAGGRVTATRQLEGWKVLAHHADRHGIDVLIREATYPYDFDDPQKRVRLLRLKLGATRPDLRSQLEIRRRSASGAEMLRTPAGVLVAWLRADGPRSVLVRDDGRPGRVHAMRGIRRPSVPKLSAAGGGRASLALITSGDKNAGALVADVAPDGRLSGVQRIPGVFGDVEIIPGTAGRVGVIVYDDGGPNGDPECNYHGDKRLWATVRDRPSGGFHQARLLARWSTVCGDEGWRIAEGPKGRFAVTWGLGPDWSDSAKSTVRLSVAEPGAGFGPPAVVATDLMLDGAAYDARGTLRIWGRRGSERDPARPPQTLIQQRPLMGSPLALAPFTTPAPVTDEYRAGARAVRLPQPDPFNSELRVELARN